MRPLWSDDIEKAIRKEAYSIDEQETPKHIKFCTKCVQSNQRPRITFDAHDVCSACQYAETKNDGTIDWKARAEELVDLLGRHQSMSRYDVLVPTSGGKDSASIAHKLKHKWLMNVNCATWAPFIYTDIGFKNFNDFVHSGFDVDVAWPNGLIHRKLTRIAFEYAGDSFLPFIYGQLNYPLHVAKHHGINLIMLGENGEAEYGGDTAANEKPCWAHEDWERIYMKGAGVDKLFKIGLEIGVFTHEEVMTASPYYKPPMDFQPEIHWYGYYEKWHPQSNYYYAAENTGFTANEGGRSTGTYSKYASIDDALDDVHYYLAFLKFGVGRATSDSAHEIRDGDIDREEAIALVKKYDGEYPSPNLPAFLDYIGCDKEHFDRVCDRFRPDHVWEKFPDGGWDLKYRIGDAQ